MLIVTQQETKRTCKEQAWKEMKEIEVKSTKKRDFMRDPKYKKYNKLK